MKDWEERFGRDGGLASEGDLDGAIAVKLRILVRSSAYYVGRQARNGHRHIGFAFRLGLEQEVA